MISKRSYIWLNDNLPWNILILLDVQMRSVIESDCQENLTKWVICNQINNCFILIHSDDSCDDCMIVKDTQIMLINKLHN